MDIFRQIGQFLKGLDKENKMTLISLRITHFQGHQSQKKMIRDIIENHQKMRNFSITKIHEVSVAGLYRELRGTWLILWTVHARFVSRPSYSYMFIKSLNHAIARHTLY